MSITHLSKGIGIKEQRPVENKIFVSTSFGLPAISLPTKPIPQLQLETVKAEPKILEQDLSSKEPFQEHLKIKEEAVDISTFDHLAENMDFQMSDLDHSFSAKVDSSSSNNNNNNIFGVSCSSSNLNHLLHSSGFGSNLNPRSHHMMKVDSTSDKTPKVGDNFQASIQDCKTEAEANDDIDDLDMLVWNPELSSEDFNVDEFLMLASSCAVHLGSHNQELALELLQKHSGKITDAVQDLLTHPNKQKQTTTMTITDDDEESPDTDFEDESESDMEIDEHLARTSKSVPWTELEVNAFYEGLVKHKKDFGKISQLIGSRTVKECVEFYYLWKNFCHDESNSFKNIFFTQCSGVDTNKMMMTEDPSGRDANPGSTTTTTTI
jgi:hypothetical protein